MSLVEIQFESSNLAPTARFFLTTQQAQAKELTQQADAERFLIDRVRDRSVSMTLRHHSS